MHCLRRGRPLDEDAADAAGHGQKDLPELKPTIEINPDHEIVKKLLARSDDAVAEDAAWLLFDQALLMEGAPLQDSAVFVQILNRMLNLSI